MPPFFIPERAMAIVAHPDDIEFSCSGTLARWARAGAQISYVLCTSGEVGFDEPGLDLRQAAAIREQEQRAAAAVVGAREVIFLREPDGLLTATLELRKKLVREIRRFRPEVVITGDPTIVWANESYINHPDHRAASTAALDAIFPAAGQPNLFADLEQEGLTAFKPRKVYVTGWGAMDLYVSIDETIEIKIAALHAHVSQMKGRDLGPRIRSWAEERAKGKEMQYAEAFKVVSLVSDEDWQERKGRVV